MNDGTDDIDPAALDRVRRGLADLQSDAASAPDVPPEVTARVVTALRREAAHSIQRPRLPPVQKIGLFVGACAALVGGIVGVVMLTRDDAPVWSRGPTAQSITVSRPAPAIPLTSAEILDLLSRPPDLGPLSAPPRLASCLEGLGFAASTKVLGAAPLDMGGRPAILILLPGEAPEAVLAKVVESTCSAAHTGLLADTAVARP